MCKDAHVGEPGTPYCAKSVHSESPRAEDPGVDLCSRPLSSLKLLVGDAFPSWMPTAAMRDTRQLLVHRHKLVEMRTRVKNQLQDVALKERSNRTGRLVKSAPRKTIQRETVS